MTGEELYAIYVEKNLVLENCVMDDWQNIIDDHDLWDAIAETVTITIK